MFVEGSTIDSESGASATVETYDQETKYLTVQVTTSQLINFGDEITDNRGTVITIPGSLQWCYYRQHYVWWNQHLRLLR